MKNIKSAISLALLAVAPAIYAQNIDTKSAPDVPTFSVTLNVTNNGGGLDSLMTKKAQSDSYDSLLFKGGAINKKLVYGTPVQVGMKAEAGKMISSFTVNGSEKTFEAAAQSRNGEVKGTVSFDKVNNYSIELGALNEKTDIVIAWMDKPEVKVTVSGTEQIVNTGTAATVTVITNIQSLNPTVSYFTDAACQTAANDEARKKVGTFYVKITSPETADHKAIDMVIPMVVNNKTELTVGTNTDAPECKTTLLQGQPLSAAVITGGKVTVKDQTDHVIKGTWAWADPNALVEAGMSTAKTYDAIFTPDSAAVYNTATTKIGITAKPVMTVTVSQTAGGVVAIENASADNKYIGSINGSSTVNPKIKVTATPDAGYKFDSWVGISSSAPGTEVDKEAKVTSGEVEITADAVVSAVFVKATRTITITSPSGNGGNLLKVLNGTQEVATGTAVPVGTTLTIVATPGEDQEVVKVGYTKKAAAQNQANNSTDPETEVNSFIVSGAAGESYTIAATFEQKPASNFLVSVAETKNGALKLKKGADDIAPNSSVEKDSYVSIIALPNKGYKLQSLTANGQNIKEASGLTVTAETTIAAVFEKETYPVAVTVPTGVEISAESGSKPFETNLGNVTATETDHDNYRLINLLVNNKPVANGSEVIVNGPTNISAQVKKLATLSILNEAVTTVTYSGKAQEYAVKTAANLGGFSVKYLLGGTKDTIPTGVGTYTVVITRPADDIYAAITEKAPITCTLVIEPGVPGIKAIPFAEAVKNAEVSGTATVAGIWTKTAPESTKAVTGLRADNDNLQTIWFVPSDPNLMVVSATTPKDQATATNIAASVTLPSVSNGSIVLMNGDVAVAAGQSVYKGQTLKIKLIPDAGYMLSGATLSGATAISKDEYTLTLTGTHTVTANGNLFVGKTALATTNIDNTNNTEKTYTGSPIELKASDLTLPQGFPTDKWVISYQKDGNTVTPTNVTTGGYDIYISRPEDANYKAFTATRVGALTIKQANITMEGITVPNATAVTTGETLLASSLTGGSVVVNGIPVPGTFSWKDNATKVSVSGTYDMTFTPMDQLNYSTTQIQTGLSAYVSLKDAASFVMTLKTVNNGAIKITDAAGGTIDQAAPSIKVAAGMKLFIETAATKTKIDKIEIVPQTTVTTETTGDKQIWSFIAPAENFAVTVTFTKESSSEGGDTPSEGVAVTGISLNKSTLTLAPKKSEKLVATVTPTGATKKDVKWTSTDPTIASVDADGTVKALKAGKATIIATTVDGGFTAMCEVTVDAATGIEKILSESRVYGQRGQIVIEPAAPVEATIVNMAGVMIYKSLVNGMEQVPAYSGIYIVRLSASGKATTTKVIVR